MGRYCHGAATVPFWVDVYISKFAWKSRKFGVWAVEKRNKNAELIADRAGKLYDKVTSFVQSMEKVGERLGLAQDSYDQAFNQLSKGRGNVISQVQTLKVLGAKTTKQITTDHDDEDLIQLEEPKQ